MYLKRASITLSKVMLLFGLASGTALGQANFEKKAADALTALPSKTDPYYLDQFIETYFGSKAADAAFSLRYNITKSKQIIEDYNEFIGRYSDTVAGHLAVHEVYELYARRQTVPSLLAFMDKYPGTGEAYVAKLKVHGMLFALARAIAEDGKQSTIERLTVIDNFIDSNKDAPQVPGAILLAKAVGVEIEAAAKEQLRIDTRKNAEAEMAAVGSKDLMYPYVRETAALKERANQLATRYEQFMSNIDEYLIDESKLNNLSREDTILVHNAIRQAERAGYVLQAVYPEQDAAARVRTEQRYIKTAKLLKSIQEAIYATNSTLITALREEFSKVSKVLSEGFSALDAQMRGVNSRLDILHGDLVATNKLLQDVNKNIVIVQEGITDLATLQSKTNELIVKQTEATVAVGELLNNDLAILHDSVLKLNADMNANAKDEKKLLVSLTSEVKFGFAQQHQDSLNQLDQERVNQEAVIDQFVGLRGSINTNFARVIDNLGQIQDGIETTNGQLVKLDGRLVQQLDQSARHHYESLRFNEGLNARLVESMESLSEREIAAIDSNGSSIREGLGIINTSINASSQALEDAIHTASNKEIAAINNNGSALKKAIYTVSENQIAAINSNGSAIRQDLGIINTSINASSRVLERAIYTGTNMVAERIDRGVAGLRQTIVETSDRQVYQLTELRRENREGFASVNRSVGDFREDFKSFASDSKSFYSQSLKKMDNLSSLANRSTAVDYQRNTNAMLSSIAGGDLKGAARDFVLGYCGELSVSGEECEDIVDKALDGKFDPAQLGSVAGRTVCERAKVKLDSETCGKLGEMIGQGKFDLGTIAQAGINEICVKAKVKQVSCGDIAKVGSVITDIYSGDWGGAIGTVASEIGKRTGPPVGDILKSIGSVAGDLSVSNIGGAIGKAIGIKW